MDSKFTKKFNEQEEELMFEMINKINSSILSLKFSGIFTFKNKQYFYITLNDMQDKLSKEICRRFEDYGKWDTIFLKMNNSTFSSSSNAICIHKKDFNPTNKQAEFL